MYDPKLAISKDEGTIKNSIAAYFGIPNSQINRINVKKAYTYFVYLRHPMQRLERYLDVYYGIGIYDKTMRMPGDADE